MTTNKFSVDTLEGYSPLAEDEPTFTFRAQDRVMADILDYYAERCAALGSSEEHIQYALDARLAVIEWQRHNGCRIPD